jgi:hypothetical protein
MRWDKLGFFLIFILFVGIVYAIDFTPSGDIEMRNVYQMKNATNVTAQNYYIKNYGVVINSSGHWVGQNITSSSSGGSGQNLSKFVNKTSTTYTANFSYNGSIGYVAAHAICNELVSGSHMCSMSEISYSMSNMTSMDWSGEAWIITGPAKYSPADLPVNDCNGFKQGVAGSYLGNWWVFNSTTGGAGATGHCGNSISIACCK